MIAFWDRLGITASVLCVIHCLLTPIAVVVLPFAAQSRLHGDFHLLIAAIVVPVALLALLRGYRIHRDTSVLWLGGLGILLMLAAMSGRSVTDESAESWLMIAGGIALSAAHYRNLRECRCQRPPSADRQAPPHDHSSCAMAAHREPGSH